MLSSQYVCTCAEPIRVEYEYDPDPSEEDDERRRTKKKKKNQQLFISNLRQYGWTPLSVSGSSTTLSEPPSKAVLLALFAQQRQQYQQQQQQQQQQDETRSGDNSHQPGEELVYIASESGATDGTIEPKESLELARFHCHHQEEAASETTRLVHHWCHTLAWIATSIIGDDLLALPPNSLLATRPHDSLDLLRCFHYYSNNHNTPNPNDDDEENATNPNKKTTNQKNQRPQPVVLGSSEHTDWGTLTVVWQDTVGGLQTYCRHCQHWNNVPTTASSAPPRHAPPATTEHVAESTTTTTTTTTTTNVWDCIVHVGDMSSLILNTRRPGVRRPTPSSAAGASSSSDDVGAWPSPLHRVVSPRTVDEERVSLVYFGYPPRGRTSLRQIQHRLRAWPPGGGTSLPLTDYYLLRDQSVPTTTNDDDEKEETEDKGDGDSNHAHTGSSASASSSTTTSSIAAVVVAEDMYHKLWNLPPEEIVQFKWQQVNRTKEEIEQDR